MVKLKAFLLAAGKGTRLRPYTDSVPKCLIDIHGLPLLEVWIALLERHHVDDVLINTHHHAEQVEKCVVRLQDRYKVKIRLSYESELLGSAGTLYANRSFVARENYFIIAYADNLTDVNLDLMVRHHQAYERGSSVLTMGLYRAPNPSACGIAILDGNGFVVDFTEKPEVPKGDLANAGIYVASSGIYDYFPMTVLNRKNSVDIGYHVLPKLVGKMTGYPIHSYLRDIGTIASYHTALDEWPKKA